MTTFTCFYINSGDLEKVKSVILSLLEGFDCTIERDVEGLPSCLGQKINTALPSCLLIGKCEPEWIVIHYNNFSSLESWMKELSRVFDAYAMVTIYDSISMYAYLGIYKSGQKIREIDSGDVDKDGKDIEGVNFGEKLDFESEQPGISFKRFDGETSYYFDDESIILYAKHFGLNVEADHSDVNWTLIRVKRGGAEEHRLSLEAKRSIKPWWRFW